MAQAYIFISFYYSFLNSSHLYSSLITFSEYFSSVCRSKIIQFENESSCPQSSYVSSHTENLNLLIRTMSPTFRIFGQSYKQSSLTQKYSYTDVYWKLLETCNGQVLLKVSSITLIFVQYSFLLVTSGSEKSKTTAKRETFSFFFITFTLAMMSVVLSILESL